jgi:hypothetical protein
MPRNHHHQRFCLKIKCRKASKAAKICAAKIKAKLRGDGDSKCFRVFDTIDKDILCRYQCLHPDSSNRGVGMVTARTRTGHDHVRDHGLSAVTVTDRSRMWTYHGAAADGHRTGHGLTTTRLRTGLGPDTDTDIVADNGADSSGQTATISRKSEP